VSSSSVQKLLLEAGSYYQKQLYGPNGRAAWHILQQRGLKEETIGKFWLGYAPGGQLITDNLSGSTVDFEEAGLTQESWKTNRIQSRFRNRLMFPLVQGGRVVGFGARAVLDEMPKYINSPESKVYHKREFLYNADAARLAARRAGRVVVVEGYFDAIACHASGVPEVVAICGTALTPNQAILLREMASTVVLALDGDQAGIDATHRTIPLLLDQCLEVKVCAWNSKIEAKDPDEIRQKHGPLALLAQVNASVSFPKWEEFSSERWSAIEKVQEALK